MKEYLPFLLQGLIMATDEFGFHHKRGLPLWEKIGHPLDTLCTLVALSVPTFLNYSINNKKLYIILALFSCLLITKDEFIHKDICSKTEQWLHALLFIIHPITFMAAYMIWVNYPDSVFLKIQFGLVLVFMFYQIIRWSFPWKQFQK